MLDPKRFTVSHAPFTHDGSSISERNYHIIFAALPAVLFGLSQYGMAAVGVVCFSISTAIFWELLFNLIRKSSKTVGDGNAALIGLLFAMLIPATTPWWAVIVGTFVCIVIGKEIFGGLGANPVNPALVGLAILSMSWQDLFDFNAALVNYDFDFSMIYPLAALKYFGVSAVEDFSTFDLLIGRQAGGIGATFGIGLIVGGIYLIARGIVRWEIPVSFLAGVYITAFIFNAANPEKFADPVIHIITGYTLIGAFFLATEDSSSPVNFIPMLIYGAGGGLLTVLIRNIGAYVDGVMFAIIVMNLVNPLLDKIRPKAVGKVL
jgi:H+/Na+-translocating ferredoxin:NAD+ oxidoreductase subunit D